MSTQRVVRVVVWGVFLPVPDQAVPSNLDVCEVTSNHSGLFNHLVVVVVVVMTVMQLLFSMMMTMIRSKNSVNTNNNAYIQARIAHERDTDGDTRHLERGTDGDTHDILSVALMATHNDTTALFFQSAVLAVDPPARGLVRVHRITHRLSLQDCVLTTVQD